jgi:hypothetical protein
VVRWHGYRVRLMITRGSAADVGCVCTAQRPCISGCHRCNGIWRRSRRLRHINTRRPIGARSQRSAIPQHCIPRSRQISVSVIPMDFPRVRCPSRRHQVQPIVGRQTRNRRNVIGSSRRGVKPPRGRAVHTARCSTSVKTRSPCPIGSVTRRWTPGTPSGARPSFSKQIGPDAPSDTPRPPLRYFS